MYRKCPSVTRWLEEYHFEWEQIKIKGSKQQNEREEERRILKKAFSFSFLSFFAAGNLEIF